MQKMDRDGYTFYKGPRDTYRNGPFDRRELNGRPHWMAGNDRNKKQKSDDSQSAASFDSTGKQKSFTRLITRFAEKTSMQGVPYINNAKLIWAKVIWTIMLIAAIAMMVVHLWYLCNQFFDFPKITKVSLGFDNLRFPSITICNTNTIHKGRFDQFDGAKKLKELVDDMKPENLVPDQFRSDYDPTDTGDGGGTAGGTVGTNGNTDAPQPPVRRKRFIEQTEKVDLSEYDPDYVSRDDGREFQEDEFDGEEDKNTLIQETFTSLFMDLPRNTRSHLGHNITDMLLSCTFAGRKCDDRMFRLHQTSTYGNCWTIESNQFRVSVSGPAGGLSFTLYLEVTEYQEGITNGYGVRLLVHEPDSFPFPEQEGHHVSASFETNVGLKMVSISREKDPYGECDPDIDSQFSKQFNLAYTRRACQSVCELEAMVAECGCFDDVTEELAFRKNRTLKPCRTEPERKCRNQMNLKVARKQVSCYCPVPCSETAYEKYFSSRQWPSDNYAMVLLESVCDKDPVVCKHIRTNLGDMRATNYNFLKLNIYYEDLNFETIEEQPEIETAQFLSDVGGAVGLWIGLSILSMCEIVQLIVELCDYARHKAGRGGRQNRKREARHRARRHSDSEADARSREKNDRSREENGRDKDIEQWPHPDFGGRSSGNSPRPPHKRYDEPRVDGRFHNLYGDYSDQHYPHSVMAR